MPTPQTLPPPHSPAPTDVIVIGAGPAGLSLANALAQCGLHATVLEQQSASVLADPPPDGREIALTHPSVALLERLGSWQRLQPQEVGLLHQAQVHDGPIGLHAPLQLHAAGTGVDHLGWIVPNYALRRSAYESAAATAGVRIITQAQVKSVATLPAYAQVQYQDTSTPGQPLLSLEAPLVVAADSRFSATRRQLGIGAAMTDFGRTVIVCRMLHEQPHHEIAHECFGYERTLAILPLPDDWVDGQPQCSAVITASAEQAQALMELSEEDFSASVQDQFGHALGAMRLVGERYAYPLVAVYAHRFSGPRCALLGDAAVGMHPVTAHGYNLGLSGVQTLSQVLYSTWQAGGDIGAASVLEHYASVHHRHAWPLFQGTNAIVRLYTDTRPLPRLLRRAILAGSARLPPLKSLIVSQLTGRH